MGDESGQAPQGSPVPQGLKQAKEIWEYATWVVDVGVAVVGFIKNTGGWVQFLVEVGTYGIACYIAIWLVLPLAVGAVSALEKGTHRTTTDAAAGLIAGVAVLGGGALIRYGLFAPGLTEDLDGIGTAFAALLGVGVLLIPLVVWWYFKGSRAA